MPQPIDPNTEMGRMTAAERIQQIADRASLVGQARMSDVADQDRLLMEQQVRQMNQKSAEVDRELARRVPFIGKRKRKKKDREEERRARTFYNADEQTEVADEDEGLDLDITI